MEFHPPENSAATAEQYAALLQARYRASSVLDLGCNVGWWLYWFHRHGAQELLGVDGDNMRGHLVVPESWFMVHDLCRPLDLHRRFDLALCLEVAEHIPAENTETLLDTIARHTDLVLWSAATPGQGGYAHVNEQPLDHWLQCWSERGFRGRALAAELPPTHFDYYRRNALELRREP